MISGTAALEENDRWRSRYQCDITLLGSHQEPQADPDCRRAVS
jgi:hypothetical protein